jgi:hypothetical protein
MSRAMSAGRLMLAAAAVWMIMVTSAAANQVVLVKTAVVKGSKLVVKYGDEVVASVDDITRASSAALREALEGVDDVSAFAKVAKSRFPVDVTDRSLYRLQSVAGELADVPGATGVMRLLVASNRANVKGALGELELAAFLLRRKDVIVTGMRETVETSLGKTDIDIAFSYRGAKAILERKTIDGLDLSDDVALKIDKMAVLAKERQCIPILSAGEIPPTGRLLRYAEQKGITVTYGGYLNQCRLVEERLALVAVSP